MDDYLDLKASTSSAECQDCPYKRNFNLISHDLCKQLFNCADSIEPLKCPQCVNFKTQFLVHLSHHLKGGHTLVKPNEKLYDCRNCDFQTYSNYLYIRHKLFNVCMKYEQPKFEGRRKLQFRDEDENDGKSGRTKIIKCECCSYVTFKSENLKRHVLFQHADPDKIKWFDCEHCPFKSKWKDCFKRHMKYKHGDKKSLNCDQCSFQTKFKDSLRNHILYKHTQINFIQLFECSQCSHKSKTKSDLKKHVKRKHSRKEILKCAHCPFETQLAHSMKYHMLAKHTDAEKIQWFECDQCPYKGKTKSNLKYHTDSKHVDDKSPNSPRFRQALKDHILAKHADLEKAQWFECAQCPYKSKRRDCLKNHVDGKHGEEAKFKCEHCEFETKWKWSLEVHLLRKHSDPEEMPWFECEHCPYKSRIKKNWSQHVKRMHSEGKDQ